MITSVFARTPSGIGETTKIADVAPDRATYRPGEQANITVTLSNQTDSDVRGRLRLTLNHLTQIVEQLEQSVELAAGAIVRITFTLTPPKIPFRGYGLDVMLVNAAEQLLADGSGALDVLERWSQAPRYGFLSDFAPGTEDVEARCDSLCRSHLNVVQFYDWMWRHYCLLPPSEEFTDALGRRQSLATVRAARACVQARGAAVLAYGAVYGAEPEFADEHLDLGLYDDAGQRISLVNLFYIMNIAPSSPWVPLIVAEFAGAVREMGFDGIHLDQYGFPRTARTATGELVDLAEHFPPLIDAARTAVMAERADAGVIFNAVENWPIATVASTTQDAVYIEVWPPDVSYNDLHRLVHEGKRLSGGKQVILAAYLSPFASADMTTLPQAEAAALFATAVIAASGGSHLLLGERDGILCDPYYPKYATLRPTFAKQLHAYYDFLVRYEEWLVGPDVRDWSQDEIEIVGPDGRPSHEIATAGSIWSITTQKPGYRLVHLINLAQQHDIAWNALRTPAEPLENVMLSLQGVPEIRQVLLLSPHVQHGQPVPIPASYVDHRLKIEVPLLRVWTIVVCVLQSGEV